MPQISDMSGYIINNGSPRGGHLEFLEILGQGSYGQVYSAVDLDAEPSAYYAVKCLPRFDDESTKHIKQKRERRLHAYVSNHPNVITFHRAIYEDQYVFFVLELCTGGTLYDAICDHKLFYRDDALLKLAFTQIVDAVHYCHENKVFHRDLKPENILCSADGKKTYLADFGLSTHVEESGSFGCGTSYYKSPECTNQGLRTSYSTRHSDVWSLGVILVNMIAARSPWRLAAPNDPCFRAFTRHRSFFEKNLPLSKASTRLLHRIFDLNPGRRITLPELRCEIRRVDTFFLSDAEILRSPKAVRDHVKFFAPAFCVKTPCSPQIKAPKRAAPAVVECDVYPGFRAGGMGMDHVFKAEIMIHIERERSTEVIDILPDEAGDPMKRRRRRSSVVKVVGRIISNLRQTQA